MSSTIPVTVVVGEVGFVIVDPPEPLTRVHKPVPIVGVFPVNVAEVPQITWSAPATAVFAGDAIVTITVSSVGPQPLNIIAHSNLYVPFDIPVTVVLGWFTFVIEHGGPLTLVHVPVPGEGLFPARVAEVVPEG
jgi:hypothetical protein